MINKICGYEDYFKFKENKINYGISLVDFINNDFYKFEARVRGILYGASENPSISLLSNNVSNYDNNSIYLQIIINQIELIIKDRHNSNISLLDFDNIKLKILEVFEVSSFYREKYANIFNLYFNSNSILFNKLSPNQKIFICNEIFKINNSSTFDVSENSKKTFILPCIKSNENQQLYNKNCEYQDKYYSLEKISGNKFSDKEKIDFYSSEIANYEVDLLIYSEFNCLRDLCLFEFTKIINKQICIKKCQFCARFIIVSNRNKIYCSKRCANRAYKHKEFDDPLLYKYSQVYEKFIAKYRRKSLPEYFDKFKFLLHDVRENKITQEVYFKEMDFLLNLDLDTLNL